MKVKYISRSLGKLTEGRVYEVVEVIPAFTLPESPHYTFEPCITVIDDSGSRATAHSHRFEEVK